MMAESAVDKALVARKYQIPRDFTANTQHKASVSVQRAFASSLRDLGTMKGDFGAHQLWMYEPVLGPVSGKNRKWLHLGSMDGGNYIVFAWDYEKDNPAVYYCDATTEWDPALNQPTASRKLTNSLSAFIRKLRPENPPVTNKKRTTRDLSWLGEPTWPQLESHVYGLGGSVCFDSEGYIWSSSLKGPRRMAPKGEVVASYESGKANLDVFRCGDELVVRNSGEVLHWDSASAELVPFQVPFNENARIRSGAFGVAALSDDGQLLLYGTDLRLRHKLQPKGSMLSVGTLTAWIDGDLDGRYIVGTRGFAGIYQGSELVAELLPAKQAKRFGTGVAVDGEHILVGSGEGIHIFSIEGGEEKKRIKFKRAKRQWAQPETVFERHGDFLWVSTVNEDSDCGLYVFARHAKKFWVPIHKLATSTNFHIAIQDGVCLLGEPPADLPVRWWPLDRLGDL
jgi:hypothetical protein